MGHTWPSSRYKAAHEHKALALSLRKQTKQMLGGTKKIANNQTNLHTHTHTDQVVKCVVVPTKHAYNTHCN